MNRGNIDGILKNKTSVSEVSDLLLRTSLSFLAHFQLKWFIAENCPLQTFQSQLCGLQSLIVLWQILSTLLHLSFNP